MTELMTALQQLKEQQQISALDYHFGRFLQQQGASDQAVLAAVLASYQLNKSHSCLALLELAYLPTSLASLAHQFDLSSLQLEGDIISDGSVLSPLVLEQGQVYMQRYWQYEQQVAEAIIQRQGLLDIDSGLLQRGLARLFTQSTADIDGQKLAVSLAIQKGFAVIAGGPGTGKTTTVVALLALLVEQHQAQGKEPRIKLAAPTGKAAARLTEAISTNVQRLVVTDEVRVQIPKHVTTLHRLLGARINSHEFKHHSQNPLHLDVLLIDEASMIDLPLMARLLQALPEHAQLILVGDKNQLFSVESGSVFNDICQQSEHLAYSNRLLEQLSLAIGCSLEQLKEVYQVKDKTNISDSIALLHKSYRFTQDSGIGHLANAINRSEIERIDSLVQENFADIELYLTDDIAYKSIIQCAVAGYKVYLQNLDKHQPEQILAAFNQFQVLAAVREGPYGVAGLNQSIQAALVAEGLIKANSEWFVGRPVIIQRNQPNLGLYNGDIGITLQDEEGQLQVYFSGDTGFSVLASRLPENETAFALTVHKSQGSEFDQVLFVLPQEDSALFSRELIYTAVTRAKKSLVLYASKTVLYKAIRRQIKRNSGLAAKLWG